MRIAFLFTVPLVEISPTERCQSRDILESTLALHSLMHSVTNLRTRFLRGTYSFDDLPQSYIAVPPLRQLPQLDPVESPIACSRESKRGKDQTHILISPSVLSRGIRPNPAARVPVFLRRFIQRSDVVQYPTVSRPWDQEDFSSARIKAGSCICTNHVGVCGDA